MTAAVPKSKSWVLVASPRYAQIWSCLANGKVNAIGIMRPQEPYQRAPASDPACSTTATAILRNFVRQMVQRLEDAARCNDFQRLILIAPPQMLDVLHDNIDNRLGHLIQTELAKDLTKGSTLDITAEIRSLLHERLPGSAEREGSGWFMQSDPTGNYATAAVSGLSG
ncbi:host attachment protein [Dongia soli]|uniref:Host attachment protein n=1 Tax=Dongia soli TaxID=600628 RepID=A0ABU5EGK0_9PROT|nr:host attachment protein [Dongia soli]MDY0884568.1 host attachment protein [Dongia soli]